MSLISDLLERPSDLSITSKYTVLNGVMYLGIGAVRPINWRRFGKPRSGPEYLRSLP
jgi:hypothetical protein